MHLLSHQVFCCGIYQKSSGHNPHLEYFSEEKEQCRTGEIKIGSITDYDNLISNLETNCIPVDVF